MSAPLWLPLESNPDIMTKFLVDMGMNPEWAVVDVIGFDAELLEFLPQPVVALILLYPVSKIDAGPNGSLDGVSSKVFYMKQTIRNACGTIALIHAVCNNIDSIPLKEGSMLESFYKKNKDKSPEERGRDLEESPDITNTHEQNAQEGQTAAPDISAEVDHHFIAIIQKDGRLFELDGRKDGPVDHGASSPETFLKDAAAVARVFISKNPECLDFTAVALAKLSN